jgi:small subunit ribosomal protein S17
MRSTKRKQKTGIVLSDKMAKTITVQVRMVANDPWVGKAVRKYTKFKAHDEKNVAKTGDTVRIEETRPLSKTKRWRLTEVIKAAKQEE